MRRNKYNAIRCRSSDGRSFHSKAERSCYEMLKVLVIQGDIRDLQCQVSIRIGPKNRRWILDFRYFDNQISEYVWADYKGFETDRWLHLVDLWILQGPAPLRVYSGYGQRMKVVETIYPEARA